MSLMLWVRRQRLSWITNPRLVSKQLKKTQESLKHEIGEVNNSMRKLEEKIDENQKSVEGKLDQLLKGIVVQLTPTSTPKKPSSSSAQDSPLNAPSMSSRTRARMEVDADANPLDELNHAIGDIAWASWGVGATCCMDQVKICSYGEEDNGPGYMVQLWKNKTAVGMPYFVVGGHLSDESQVPNFERLKQAKRQTRNNSRSKN